MVEIEFCLDFITMIRNTHDVLLIANAYHVISENQEVLEFQGNMLKRFWDSSEISPLLGTLLKARLWYLQY